MICDELIEHDKFVPFVAWRLAELRLTCKAINSKMADYFARNVFKRLVIHTNRNGLDRLKCISEHTLLASKVQSIYLIGGQPGGSWKEYEELELSALDPERPRQERNEHHASLRNIRKEQDEMTFIENSGIDSIELAMAIRSFTNLTEVLVDTLNSREDSVSMRRHMGGDDSTTTRRFSMLAATLPYTKVTIRKCHIRYFKFQSEEALSIQALALPKISMQALLD